MLKENFNKIMARNTAQRIRTREPSTSISRICDEHLLQIILKTKVDYEQYLARHI
jgi:hypothetical protein